MATAKKDQIQKTKTIVETEDVVVLTLTKEEAKTLGTLTHFIGGCPRRSRRKHMDSINNALVSAGVDTWGASHNVAIRAGRTPCITFAEESGVLL